MSHIKKKIRNSYGDKIFDGINIMLLVMVSLTMVIPFIYIIVGSFATSQDLMERSFFLIPKSFTMLNYEYIFSSPSIPNSLVVSLLRTVLGTIINLVFTATLAFSISHKCIVGRRVINSLLVFTIIFNGGMIPTYLVVRGTGLLDSIWSLLIPGAINTFNLMLWKTFFSEIPEEMEEAAQIDGCNDLTIFIKIILPLSFSSIATFTVFYAVAHWNAYFDAMMYINDSAKWPIQIYLRQVVILSQGGVGDLSSVDLMPPDKGIKFATIIISAAPIMIIYPFMQKYFMDGVMMGAVKG